MELSARKVYPLTGTQTVTNRHILDLVPFTACNNKPLDVVRVSRDGDMVVKYVAPTPITDFEGKTSLSLFKMCLDADAHKGESAVKSIKDEGSFIEVQVDVRDMANYITGRSSLERRAMVYNSLKKVKDMSVDMTKTLPGGKEQNISTSWIYEIATFDDYETATVWINKTALAVAAADGIAYNLKYAIQYRGRAFLLYLHLQSWKTEAKRGKYIYQHYIPHESIVQALDLEGTVEKKQMRFIRESFKAIGLNYGYKKHLNKWAKGKMP